MFTQYTYPINRFSKFKLTNLAELPPPQQDVAVGVESLVTIGAVKNALFVTSLLLTGVTTVVATRLDRVINFVPTGSVAVDLANREE